MLTDSCDDNNRIEERATERPLRSCLGLAAVPAVLLHRTQDVGLEIL